MVLEANLHKSVINGSPRFARDDAKRQLGAKRRGCDAQSVSLTLFAMTRSDDEGIALWRCKGWRILVRHEGLEEGVCR